MHYYCMEIFIVAIKLCTRILCKGTLLVAHVYIICILYVYVYFSKHGSNTTLYNECSSGGTTIMGFKHYTKCVCRVHFVDWCTNTYIHIVHECG